MSTLKAVAIIFILFSMFSIQTFSHYIHLHKRSFKSNCDGVYDLSLYARCDRVCEECYEIYKDTDIHAGCKFNCFNNSFFDKCALTLLPEFEAHELIQKMKELSKPK